MVVSPASLKWLAIDPLLVKLNCRVVDQVPSGRQILRSTGKLREANMAKLAGSGSNATKLAISYPALRNLWMATPVKAPQSKMRNGSAKRRRPIGVYSSSRLGTGQSGIFPLWRYAKIGRAHV